MEKQRRLSQKAQSRSQSRRSIWTSCWRCIWNVSYWRHIWDLPCRRCLWNLSYWRVYGTYPAEFMRCLWNLSYWRVYSLWYLSCWRCIWNLSCWWCLWKLSCWRCIWNLSYSDYVWGSCCMGYCLPYIGHIFHISYMGNIWCLSYICVPNQRCLDQTLAEEIIQHLYLFTIKFCDLHALDILQLYGCNVATIRFVWSIHKVAVQQENRSRLRHIHEKRSAVIKAAVVQLYNLIILRVPINAQIIKCMNNFGYCYYQGTQYKYPILLMYYKQSNAKFEVLGRIGTYQLPHPCSAVMYSLSSQLVIMALLTGLVEMG
eukprot:TRINITY_DN262_c0_g1_i13.p1 TRINITY_DN262_c0_g1~~TRINITY_DN262_c0_g1_i13.p1  ORF type:complete len:315 (-),score=-44.63 TRINITY_DN262_c0_g1_i13:41-985(-)